MGFNTYDLPSKSPNGSKFENYELIFNRWKAFCKTTNKFKTTDIFGKTVLLGLLKVNLNLYK